MLIITARRARVFYEPRMATTCDICEGEDCDKCSGKAGHSKGDNNKGAATSISSSVLILLTALYITLRFQ